MIPFAESKRFEQLEPGDLFLFFSHEHKFVALKTQRPPTGDRSEMVILGPVFPDDVQESYLLPWEAQTTLSFGKSFSILIPTDLDSWSLRGPSRDPVCLAVADGRSYICTNGSSFRSEYLPCFVDLETGVVIEWRLPGHPVFTNQWEIVTSATYQPPKSILRFPLLPNKV